MVEFFQARLCVVRKRARRFATKILQTFYIWLHRYLHSRNVLPIDRTFGQTRGTAVGRYYVENFLRKNSDLVSDRCLEFGDSRYRPLFPRARIYKILSVYPGPDVDYAYDIHEPNGVPEAAFDSILCTQVLEHLAFSEKATRRVFRLLKPGGILILSAPFINNIHYGPTEFRRFTPDGVRLILEPAGFAIEELEYGGNSAVSTGPLLGMLTEDFSVKELDRRDPIYPYNFLVRARRPL